MNSQIEGVPDGFELVAIRRVAEGEFFISRNGSVGEWSGPHESNSVYLVIRKIEVPKQYRAFANAAEFEPHRDKWVNRVDDKKQAVAGLCRVSAFDDEGIWLSYGVHSTYQDAFDRGHKFADGTPFGVEVTP